MATCMKAMCNKTIWVAMLSTLWAVGAAAWALPRIAVHPLEVTEGMDSERWNALWMREVAKQNVAMMPQLLVEAFLQSQGGSCKGEAECLQALGYATKASYVLEAKVSALEVFVTSDRRVQADGVLREEKVLQPTKLYVASARILLVDGTVAEAVSLEVAPVSGVREEANAMAVYAKLLEELKLERLPSHPGGKAHMEEYLLREPLQMVLAPPPPAQDKHLRTASYTLLGTSAATAVTGSVFLSVAIRNKDKAKKAKSNPEKYKRSADGYKEKAKWQDKVGFSLLGAAGVTALTGIALLIVSKHYNEQPVSLGLMPTQGGALLSVQGRFP